VFFSNKKLHVVIFGVSGVLFQGSTYADSLTPLPVDVTSIQEPATLHDDLWTMREQAFADATRLSELSSGDPKEFKNAQALFFRELSAAMPTSTSDASGNRLVWAMTQVQEIAKKITNCSKVNDAPKKIKEFAQQLQQQKLGHLELAVAPYITHILGGQLAVELSLRPDQNSQRACIEKLLKELHNNGLDAYGQMLIGILQQGPIQRIPPELIPIVMAKSFVGDHFKTLRDIQHYKDLLQQYPNKTCDPSYFYYINYLDGLMQEDPGTIEANEKQMVHVLYALCTALHNAAINIQ